MPGMDDHLVKPVSLDALQNVLRGLQLSLPDRPSSSS